MTALTGLLLFVFVTPISPKSGPAHAHVRLIPMSLSLRPTPSSSTQRGILSIQPAYFTSSLFVDALRADIQQLASVFSLRYHVAYLAGDESSQSSSSSSNPPFKPFILFKGLWTEYGWDRLHLKVLETRAREIFICVILRCFLGQFIMHIPKLGDTWLTYILFIFV